MMESYRVQRVERAIREIASTFLISHLSSEMDGFATLTRVICSRDLKTAKILVHTFEGVEKTKKNVQILKDHAHEIQRELHEQLRMKYCPKIQFHVDDKYEEALRVQEELRRLELERQSS